MRQRSRNRRGRVLFHEAAPTASHEMTALSAAGLIEKRADGCWEWCGHIGNDGYGRVPDGKLAHRTVYECLVGVILPDHAVHHECRNKRCVNPEHLTSMPQGEHTGLHNSLRAVLLHGDAAI